MNGNGIYFRNTAPVVFILFQFIFFFGNILYAFIWTGTNRCRVEIGHIYICVNDGTHWLCQIIRECRIWLCCFEDNIFSINFNAVQFQVTATAVHLCGTLDGCFNGFRGHIISVGEFYALTDVEFIGSVIYHFPGICKPWNYFHVFVCSKQGFCDTAAHGCPSIPSFSRIKTFHPHKRCYIYM